VWNNLIFYKNVEILKFNYGDNIEIKKYLYPSVFTLMRLNQVSVIIERTGFFYGQCSEICGVLHSSMPIKIEAVEVEKFFS
jgi:heme/copper-type cytochrome/quinol oxidase subunit 2